MPNGQTWSESTVEIAGTKLHLSRAGSGKPLLVLHHDIGTVDRLDFYDALAGQGFDVLVPNHPGYGKSERPAWLRHPRDIAAIYQWLLADLGLNDVSLVGLGFGGWIAAEMASLAPRDFRRVVLVGPMGIKPAAGDILDQAIVSYIDYAKAFFHDPAAFEKVYGSVSTDQLEIWDICREMSFRVAWKPYMYSQTLPHLLGGVKAPTLIVWGEQDKVVPVSTAEQFLAALPHARREIVRTCGHAVEMEQPSELAHLVSSFVTAD
ncbi:MAG: alpha/beta hydrolase [Acetobacteraceae bacterium]|nr:alpha/beta hydrolase [Acetobacteraceae bacterium]